MKSKVCDTADSVTYYALVQAVEGNPTARTMILDARHKASALTLFTAFGKRIMLFEAI